MYHGPVINVTEVTETGSGSRGVIICIFLDLASLQESKMMRVMLVLAYVAMALGFAPAAFRSVRTSRYSDVSMKLGADEKVIVIEDDILVSPYFLMPVVTAELLATNVSFSKGHFLIVEK